MEHPGAAESVEAGLRNRGLVGPIIKRLAPGLDAGAVLAEIRDRIGEIAFRFFFGPRVASPCPRRRPAPRHCILCPDGWLCLLDFGPLRDLDADYLDGERNVARALTDDDLQRVHDGLSNLGYLPEPPRPPSGARTTPSASDTRADSAPTAPAQTTTATTIAR